MHTVYPKEAIENQGRKIPNIIRAIDTKTQGLINVPIAIDNVMQTQIQSLQASTAILCRVDQAYTIQDNFSISAHDAKTSTYVFNARKCWI